MKKLSRKSAVITKGLLDYLKETGKEKLLPEVVGSLQEESEKGKKKKEIVVTSAVELNTEEKQRLESLIKKKFSLDYSLVNQVDKNLIGGFTVKVDDWFVDASFLYQLKRLRNLLF